MMTAVLQIVTVGSGVLLSGQALAQGHSYVNFMRSSTQTHVFVQQSVDGEFGEYSAQYETEDEQGNKVGARSTQKWKGYSIGTSAGIEMMKFVQFELGHAFVNMRYKDDALESLAGSRLHAGMRLVFLSPVGNLEGGAGFQGSRLDYRKQLESAMFYGSGTYYSLGLNYFLSSRFSVYGEAKMAREHLVNSSGSSSTEAFRTETTMMGLGFRLWM